MNPNRKASLEEEGDGATEGEGTEGLKWRKDRLRQEERGRVLAWKKVRSS